MIPKESTLEELVESARTADRMLRITFRDPIAVHGNDAVAAVRSWLLDPELGRFAVRVLGAAGGYGARSEAVAALHAAYSAASEAVQRDIDFALETLGATRERKVRADTPKPPPEPEPNLYRRLVRAARERATLTYSDVAPDLGLSMKNPHHRRVIGQYLAVISDFEDTQGRPMLSAVVVLKGGGKKRAGPGVKDLGEELGLKSAVEDESTFLEQQLTLVYDFWASDEGAALAAKIEAGGL